VSDISPPQVFKDGLRVASERATNRDDQYFSDDPHKLFDLDQPLVMHELLERESKIDPSNPYLRYPEEIKNQRLAGVLGFTKHDILYASTSTRSPEVIDLDDTAQDLGKTSGEKSFPAEAEAEMLPTAVMTPREAPLLDDSESEDSLSELVDSDSDSETDSEGTGKYSRLRKGTAQRVPALANSVIDLTESASDEDGCSRGVLREIVQTVNRPPNPSSRKKTSGDRPLQPENIDIQILEDLVESSLHISERKLSTTIAPPLRAAHQIQTSQACPPVGLSVLRPMTNKIAEEYDRLIALAQRYELSDESSALAAEHYLLAIELCDEDLELHRKLSQMKSRLEASRAVAR
jgi:hypothetical protein